MQIHCSFRLAVHAVVIAFLSGALLSGALLSGALIGHSPHHTVAAEVGGDQLLRGGIIGGTSSSAGPDR